MHWVFAYGSNMHVPDLKRWLRERGYPSEGLYSAEPARLSGYRLVWNYFSNVRNGAAANVERKRGHEVRGVALAINDSLLEAIDEKEGHPERYFRGTEPVPAESLWDGRTLNTWLYIVRPVYLSKERVAPRRDYLGLMVEAARAYRLGTRYIKSLQQIPTAD